MLNLIAVENIAHVDKSGWDINIDKSSWQNEFDLFTDSLEESASVEYAETARFVRFGKAKTEGSQIKFGASVDSIDILLHSPSDSSTLLRST